MISDVLPPEVSRTLIDRILQRCSSAFLRIGDDGSLEEQGGDLSTFGLDSLVIGEPATPQLLFLEGLMPFSGPPITLPMVDLGHGRYADIHLLADGAQAWVILLDRRQDLYWRGQAQQKANELRLLRQRLDASGSKTEPLQAAREPQVCGALNLIALEWDPSGSFRLLATPPPDFEAIFPEAYGSPEGFHPESRLAFLENFLTDARKVWEGAPGPLRSGPWVEQAAGGREFAFDAIATNWDGRHLLFLELLGDRYEERRSFLQLGRENALVKRYLEEEVHRRTREIRVREEEIALRLVWAAESKDKGETGAHIRRIGLYSELLAGAIGWERERLDDIRIAATMHDIGKIGIPDNVLQKPGPLTADEFAVMKTHPVIGGRILSGSSCPMLQMARDIALSHHEKWDGSGYPYGLAREAIPLASRIVAIADVFDALVHERVYKRGMSTEAAIKIMERNAGTHFDPDLFAEFLRLKGHFHGIAQDHSPILYEGFCAEP